MLQNNIKHILIVGFTVFAPICFGQSVYLKCDGFANRSTIMGDKSSTPISTTIELDESRKLVDISSLFEIAPRIEMPYQEVLFSKEKIIFSSKINTPGDFLSINGEINRYTEGVTIDYTNINQNKAGKMISIKTLLNCKTASVRKF